MSDSFDHLVLDQLLNAFTRGEVLPIIGPAMATTPAEQPDRCMKMNNRATIASR